MADRSQRTRLARRALIAACVCALAAPLLADDAAVEAEGRRIRGQVTDEAGVPLVGSIVRIRRSGLSATEQQMRPEAWTAPVVVTTDADGEFVADGLDGDAFVVRAEASGRAAETIGNIPAGAWLSLHLRPGHVVTGSVTDATTGHALAGATVVGCDPMALSFGREACIDTVSDRSGSFALAGVPAGELQLRADAAGHDVSGVLIIDVPAAEGPADPVLELRPGARVRGRVVDERDRPVPGALVYARPLAGSDDMLRPEKREWPTHSDANGEFAIDGLPAGLPQALSAFRADRDPATGPRLELGTGEDVDGVVIVLSAPPRLTLDLADEEGRAVRTFDLHFRAAGKDGGEYRGPVEPGRVDSLADGGFAVRFPDSGSFDLLFVPEGYSELTRSAVELGAGRTTALGTLVVTEGLVVTGTVSEPDGEAIPFATVEATWSGTSSARARRVLADPDGRYRLAGLDDAPLRIEARSEGFDSDVLEEVEPGTADADLTLTRRGGLAGSVELEEGGAPEAFVIVIHVEADGATGDRDPPPGFPRESPFTGDEGAYEFKDIPPGRYTVEARATGRASGRRTGVRVVSGEVAEVPSIELGRGLTLEGRVVRSDDETPVQGAEIEASKRAGSLIAVATPRTYASASDEEGVFRIEGLEPGPHTVRARHADFAPRELAVELSEDSEADDVVLRLSAGGSLVGTVQDASGGPAVGRRVFVYREIGDRHFDYAVTDDHGGYEIVRIAPGSYLASLAPATPGSIGVGPETAVIRDGEATRLDFDEGTAIALSGTVYQDGEPVTRASLFFARSVSLAEFKATRTDSTGRYEIGLDESGTYRVMVQKGPNGAAGGASTEITVPDERHVEQDIHLGSDGLAGTVTDEDGGPIAGAVVSAIPHGADVSLSALFVAETGANGRYSIQGLQPGLYRLTASAPGLRVGIVEAVDLAEGAGAVTVDFRLEPGDTLVGRIVDALGNGIPGTAVLVGPAGSADPWGTGAATAVTDVNGAFRMTAPTDGPLDVTALPSGWAPVRLRGIAAPTAPDELLLEATRGGSISVTVLGEQDEPVPGLSVSLRAVPAFLGSELSRLLEPISPTDGNGATLAEHLAPGDYEVGVPGRNPAVVTVGEGGIVVAQFVID